MNRLLICAALALGLAACGGQQGKESTSTAANAPAATEKAQPAAPEKPAAAGKEAGTVAAAGNDGETVDNVTTAAVSPIEQAVAAEAPAHGATLPAKWQPGVNFSALPAAQPVSVAPGQVEVTEIFWYGCGHCFALEPRLEAWEKKGEPSYVKMVWLPVIWNDVTRSDARVYYTLEALGRRDLHLAVFREIHVNHKPLTIVRGNAVDAEATQQRVRDFLVAHGVSSQDFDHTYRSFDVEMKLREAENLTRRYNADHTPMFVVQGKYTTDVSMAGGVDPLFELLDDLTAREHAER